MFVYFCSLIWINSVKFSQISNGLKERNLKDQKKSRWREIPGRCAESYMSVKLLNNFNQINYADALIDICTCVYL